MQFLWKCDFEKSLFDVSYSYSLGYDRLQKMQNILGKYLKISQKLNGGGRKHIMVFKKTKVSKSTDELFFTLCQLQLSISLRIVCDLFPVL